MAGSIPIKKVYRDSRFQTKDSTSNSDFKHELESMILPDEYVAFVDDVILPVSWYNIDESNQNIYVRRMQYLETAHFADRIVSLEVSNHTTDTLTDAVQDALNTAFGTGVFTVSYDET